MGASHAVFPLAHDHHPTANSGEGSPLYTGPAQQWFNNGMYSLSEDQTADLEKVLSNGQFRDSPRVLRENLRRKFGFLHFSPSIFLSRSRNSEISWSFFSSALSTLSPQSFMHLFHR